MRAIVQWAVRNGPSMNSLMIGILGMGMFALFTLQREVFPNFELEIVYVSVPYPGASPADVEQTVCLKIEEELASIDGIKKLTSVANEGSGTVVAELEVSADPQKLRSEIETAVDGIVSFPEFAEKPTVRQVTVLKPAIRVALTYDGERSPAVERRLRDRAEVLRDRLLQLDSVTQVDLAAPDYEITVEVSEAALREYGLTLTEFAARLRQQNAEIPAGTLKGANSEYLLRVTNKRVNGKEIAELPILTETDGTSVKVRDLATVRDAFADTDYATWLDGKPAIVLTVQKTKNEDLLVISDAVNEFVGEYRESGELPPGYDVIAWGNEAIQVRDRLRILRENGTLGLILVFIALGLFLDLRLSFWVALGIPVSILGSCAMVMQLGGTLNMISMFAFIMGIGIVVDDAIVIGENVYRHRQMGKSSVQAAIDGTVEVVPSVVASVLTTVMAFAPMLFVTGIMGKFIAIMPVALISMLILSLIESTFILPVHLAHEGRRSAMQIHRDWENRIWGLPTLLALPLVAAYRVVALPLALVQLLAWAFAPARRVCQGGMEWFVSRVYAPSVRWSLGRPSVVYASAFAMVAGAGGLVVSGVVPMNLFPKLDAEIVKAQIFFPTGTPAEQAGVGDDYVSNAKRATALVEGAARRLAARYRERYGSDVIMRIQRDVGIVATQNGIGGSVTFGGHVGTVTIQLASADNRKVTSNEVIAAWREETGEIPGVAELTFANQAFGPGGNAFEFKVLGRDDAEVQAAAAKAVEHLAGYRGVRDLRIEPRPGKYEMRIRVKPRAEALGVRQDELARTIRASYYGEEVMRVQRGRHDVKIMVRYPETERKSMAAFEEIRVRTPEGEIPIRELAEVTFVRGYTELERREQARSVTVTADLDEQEGNALEIVADLEANFIPGLYREHPGVRIDWEGQQERDRESLTSLAAGFAVAVLAMFALLTLEFRSYLQPLLILAIIPFGLVGAVVGHAVAGLPVTLFSFFGIVALAGVLANDSIVLVDFINRRQEEGMSLEVALREAGRQRFRPVFLTSLTTIAGLVPMLLETSIQAQLLIPMALSISFGLLFATVLVLILVPVMYQTMANLFGIGPRPHEE